MSRAISADLATSYTHEIQRIYREVRQTSFFDLELLWLVGDTYLRKGRSFPSEGFSSIIDTNQQVTIPWDVTMASVGQNVGDFSFLHLAHHNRP